MDLLSILYLNQIGWQAGKDTTTSLHSPLSQKQTKLSNWACFYRRSYHPWSDQVQRFRIFGLACNHTMSQSPCVDRSAIWFGFLITYFWRYLERSGGVLIIMSFLRHVVLWWLETHSAPLGMITLPWATEWVQRVTLCNVYSTYSGNENTVLGIAEKDDIRASGRWVVKVI